MPPTPHRHPFYGSKVCNETNLWITCWHCFTDGRYQRTLDSAAALHAFSPGIRGCQESWGPGEQLSCGHPGINGSCADRVWPPLPQSNTWSDGQATGWVWHIYNITSAAHRMNKKHTQQCQGSHSPIVNRSLQSVGEPIGIWLHWHKLSK